jgi:3,4-dihydroxy 2-butanone 4-phosphate synthase/GTP cyclohydrolase II
VPHVKTATDPRLTEPSEHNRPTPEPPPQTELDRALSDVAKGRAVVVYGDCICRDRGYLVFAAQHATSEILSHAIRDTSGFIRVSMPPERMEQLELPMMVRPDDSGRHTSHAVSVDAATGVSTGISAKDRARTIRLLASEATTAADLTLPGHVVPICAAAGGLTARVGFAEAALALVQQAGMSHAAVLCELVDSERGSLLNRTEIALFCAQRKITPVSLSALRYSQSAPPRRLTRVASRRIVLPPGTFDAHAYRDLDDGRVHTALVHGDLRIASATVRVQRECILGAASGSLSCACARQTADALEEIRRGGNGVLIHVRSSNAPDPRTPEDSCRCRPFEPTGDVLSCPGSGEPRADEWHVSSAAEAILRDITARPAAHPSR